MNKQPTKRKYNPKKMVSTKRRQTKGITSKYSAKKNKKEIKTLDGLFSDAYAKVYVSDTQTAITFNDKGCIQNVVRAGQGAGISQRIGNKIALKSLRIRASLELTANGGTPPPQSARMMVIYDRQPNGVYPALDTVLSDILQNNSMSVGNFLSSINPNFYDRYIVLCDKIFIIGANPLNGTDNGPTEMKQFIIDEFIKLKGLEVQFKSSTDTGPIADLATGALYVIGWGDQTDGSEPYCMTAKTRLRFYDN